MSTFLLYAPATLHASVSLPSSKSISNRGLILNALSGGKTFLENLSDCDDCNVLIESLKSDKPLKDTGAAGTAMRFLTAYYSLQDGVQKLTGSNRMKDRPIRILVDALNQLGGNIKYTEKDGFPPLQIGKGRFTGKEIDIDGSVSSQYLSALMMIAPKMEKGLHLHILNGTASRPYIEMTASMMKQFGATLSLKGNDIYIAPGYKKAPESYRIEADWSSASYWFEMLCLAPDGEIQLNGLQKNSIQGDARISEWFELLGIYSDFRHIDDPNKQKNGSTRFGKETAKLILQKKENNPLLRKTGSGNAVLEIDFSLQPDLAQTLTVCCALKDIPFYFTGLGSLRIKETDRIQALADELKKLGFLLTTKEDSIRWNGERGPVQQEIRIDTYNDHRMAMAFAPAVFWTTQQKGIRSFGIRHTETVCKSYPAFWEDLKKAGFTLETEA